MDSPCIKQTVCKVLKIFQYGKYLVAYVLKQNYFLRFYKHFYIPSNHGLLLLPFHRICTDKKDRSLHMKNWGITIVDLYSTHISLPFFFVGHQLTMQNQIRRRKMRHLIRFSTIGLHKLLSKFE